MESQMHKVNRITQPKILSDNYEKWTSELIEQIALNNGDYSKVNDKYKNQYNQREIKESLKNMYNGCCCYCEGSISLVSYGAIEHFKPKSLYPELSFVWDNLHYCCEICNTTYKKSQWNDLLLDPSKDDISLYLSFNIHTGEYEAIQENERGKETIRITGINREKLVKKRRQMIAKLSFLNKNLDREQFFKYIQLLEKRYITVYKTFFETINGSIVI